SFARLFRTLTKVDLLFSDNLGPDRLGADQRRDLREIVEDRHGCTSTLIASQLPVKAWHDLVGDPTFADAILDRLLHNACARCARPRRTAKCKPRASGADGAEWQISEGRSENVAPSLSQRQRPNNRDLLLRVKRQESIAKWITTNLHQADK